MADWWTQVYIINMYLQFIFLQNVQTQMLINWIRHDMCKTELHAEQRSGHVSGNINKCLNLIQRTYILLSVRISEPVCFVGGMQVDNYRLYFLFS